MKDAFSPVEPAAPRRKRTRVMDRLRGYFIAGILVTGPLALTLYLTWSFIHFIDDTVGFLLPSEYNPETYLPVPGLGLVLAVVVLTLVGALTAGYIGRLLLRMSERVMARMPVIRSIYGAVKQIFETVLASKSNSFREVVLTEWPRSGMWTMAFVTVQPLDEIRELVGSDAVAIFVPTTPNPTGGYLTYVRRRDLVTLDMTVEEALKYIVSCGIVAPAVVPKPRAEIASADPPRLPSA
ncbi:MAG TPA: DUF502 domain-containing protein [Stellaceae bacterium]|nr:DUF502 domain-containing protein [Stellaceae bacterium]